MPLFKKSTSDSGQMSENHKRVLHRCRMLLIKDLDVAGVFEYLGTEDFKPEVRELILSYPTREQRVGVFLDKLETRGDRAFFLFMEALKEQYKHLHYIVAETIRTFGELRETQHRERAAMTGDVVRKLLKSNIKRRTEHSHGSESAEDLDLFIDDGEDDKYLDCYAIPLRGRLQSENWIKHVTTPRVVEHRDTKTEPDTTYMATLMKDLVFKRLAEQVDVPQQVSKPPKYCQVFVIDEENKYGFNFATPEGEVQLPVLGADKNGHDSAEGGFPEDNLPPAPGRPLMRNKEGSSRRRRQMPVEAPPVPPKPDHLPPIPTCLPGMKSRESASLRLSMPAEEPELPPSPALPPPSPALPPSSRDSPPPGPPPRTTSKSPPVPMEKQPPPLPVLTETHFGETVVTERIEKPYDAVSGESDSDVEEILENAHDDKELPVEPNSLGCDLEGNIPVSYSFTNGLDDDENDEPHSPEETYNDSACSTLTLTYEQEKRLQELEGSFEEQYEAVTPRDDRDGALDSFANGMERASTPEMPPKLGSLSEEMEEVWKKRDVSRESSPGTDTEQNVASIHDESSKASADSMDSVTKSTSTSDSGIDRDRSGRGLPSLPPRVMEHRPMPRPPAMLPRQLADVDVVMDDRSSTDGSYYEDIDVMDKDKGSVCYLDPKSYAKSFEKSQSIDANKLKTTTSRRDFNLCEVDVSGRIMLRSGDMLVAETRKALVQFQFPAPEDETSPTESEAGALDPLKSFKDTTMAFDKYGHAFYIPTCYLKRHGDPEGEAWFYPIDICSRQATLFLSMERQEGCFVVYRPRNKQSGATFNLSLCRSNGDVVHYHILENIHGDVMVEGHDHSFMNIHDLVDYFKRNKSQLATRLRRPLREARMAITPGHHYNVRYEIDRHALSLTGKIIGKGNFGVVCAGIYQNLPVAVKVLQKGDVSVPEEDDFVDEAKIMMGLKHDHVVRLIGLSCAARPFFLVTEYMPKGSLRDCLRNGTIPADNLDTLFDICIQAASAMYYIEGIKYLLHRDVATRNFLVADDMCIKLADFGRARRVNDDQYQAPSSEKMAIKWSAPEVLMEGVYSTKSDVWSLGVVFWEILSGGDRPYSTLSGEQTAVYVTEGGRLEKPPGCPPDLYALMNASWRHQPEERPTFTVLYDKLKSKSSIYYSGPIQGLSVKRASGESNKSASPLLPLPNKISNGPKLPTTPGKNQRKTLIHQEQPMDDFEAFRHANRDSRGEGSFLPSSSSETSLVSGFTEYGKEDISRSDKIRKSLRKMMTIKSKRKSAKFDNLKSIPQEPPGHFYAPG